MSVEELADQIRHHDKLYYNQQPELSDAEYDGLRAQYQALLDETGEEDLLDGTVGAPVDETTFLQDVTHTRAMLSLDKVYTQAELQQWIDKQGGKPLVAWPKFDGVSMTLIYEAGALVRAATRGNGQTGKDVTHCLNEIEGVQQVLGWALNGEIRGEVVMKKSQLAAYNAKHPDNPLANPRNAASGSLMAKDRSKVADRKLTFLPYDILDYDTEAYELMPHLKQAGYTPERATIITSAAEAFEYLDKAEADRDSLDYDIDGAVFRIADNQQYLQAGFVSHHPKGAMAYKLTAQTVEAQLESITWQIGRTGVHTPVGHLKVPALVAGAMVSKATLHNYGEITRRDIRLNDRVTLQRAGDVIPQITGPVDTDKRDGSETPVTPPSVCLSCGTPLDEVGDSKLLVCPNSTGCGAQASGRLVYWTSKNGADIKTLGAKQIGKLESAGLLKTPSDLYALTSDQLQAVEGIQERSASNIIEAINGAKNLGMRKAMVCLGIPGASRGTAKDLHEAGYLSIDDVAAATPEQLAEVENIGDIVAKNIHEYLNKPEVQAEIARLKSLGVVLEDAPAVTIDGPLTGKKFVLTGSLSIPRPKFAELLEAAGASVGSGVSKNTDYLVAGEAAGSKRDKAEKLGVTVLDEGQARAMMA